MLRLKKNSQLATVDPEIKVAEYERRLNEEGLTGGYHPLQGDQVSIDECLKKRLPNLFSLKYGGIDDLCAGGVIELPDNKHFTIKTAPRAATGSDLKKVIIGSDDCLGRFEEVTLRVFPLPESQMWGLALFEMPGESALFLRRMFGFFIRPLFVRLLDEEEAGGLLRSLNLKEADKVIVAFKLTGLKGMVEAEKETLLKLYEGEKVFFYWPTKSAEVEILDETLITPEGWVSFMEKASPFAGKDPKVAATEGERKFREFISELY